MFSIHRGGKGTEQREKKTFFSVYQETTSLCASILVWSLVYNRISQNDILAETQIQGMKTRNEREEDESKKNKINFLLSKRRFFVWLIKIRNL